MGYEYGSSPPNSILGDFLPLCCSANECCVFLRKGLSTELFLLSIDPIDLLTIPLAVVCLSPIVALVSFPYELNYCKLAVVSIDTGEKSSSFDTLPLPFLN
jgi:hypothetical protein